MFSFSKKPNAQKGLLPDEIIKLATKVIEQNAKAGRKIVVAESCTGGLVAGALTEIPGSSAVFDRGYVTYSNEAKHECLGVSRDLIEAFGAVSVAVVYEMAKGALELSGADVAVAVSGIAGPGGGTEIKPVGTVVFAKAERGVDEPEAEQMQFDDNGRGGVRAQAVIVALELLLP